MAIARHFSADQLTGCVAPRLPVDLTLSCAFRGVVVLDTASAEWVAIESERSEALDMAIRTVADTDLGEGPKYGPTLIAALSRTIGARAYGKPFLELCHFLRAAELAGGRHGWPGLIWGLARARPSAFQGALSRAPTDPRYQVSETGILLRYDDREFLVTYGRMPFLTVLLEFLVTMVGYQSVDDLVRGLLEAPFRREVAGPVANDLSREMYEALKPHLPSVQSQRVFRRLSGALIARHGRSFELDQVDDGFVLDLWVDAVSGPVSRGSEEADPDGGGPSGVTRSFRTLAEQVARFRSAVEEGLAAREMRRPAALGAGREQGEIAPDRLLAAVDAHELPRAPLALLAEPPAATVKFLNRSETARAEAMLLLGRQVTALPLTTLRADSFGRVQARLIHAVRSRRPDEVENLATCEAGPGYTDTVAAWHALEQHTARVGLAALTRLLEAGRPEAVLEVTAWAPDFDPGRLRGLVSDAARGDTNLARLASVDLAGTLARPEVGGPEMAALLERARTALRGLTRLGFRPEDRGAPAALDGMAVGAPSVRRVRADLCRVLRAVEAALGERPDDLYARDRAVFRGRFLELYGRRVG